MWTPITFSNATHVLISAANGAGSSHPVVDPAAHGLIGRDDVTRLQFQRDHLINAISFREAISPARASGRLTAGVSMKSERFPIASKVYRELVRKAAGPQGLAQGRRQRVAR